MKLSVQHFNHVSLLRLQQAGVKMPWFNNASPANAHISVEPQTNVYKCKSNCRRISMISRRCEVAIRVLSYIREFVSLITRIFTISVLRSAFSQENGSMDTHSCKNSWRPISTDIHLWILRILLEAWISSPILKKKKQQKHKKTATWSTLIYVDILSFTRNYKYRYCEETIEM